MEEFNVDPKQARHWQKRSILGPLEAPMDPMWISKEPKTVEILVTT